MHRIRAETPDLSPTGVKLWVLAENQRAQRFYTRRGLRRDGQTGVFRPRGTDLDFPIVRWALLPGSDQQ